MFKEILTFFEQRQQRRLLYRKIRALKKERKDTLSKLAYLDDMGWNKRIKTAVGLSILSDVQKIDNEIEKCEEQLDKLLRK